MRHQNIRNQGIRIQNQFTRRRDVLHHRRCFLEWGEDNRLFRRDFRDMGDHLEISWDFGVELFEVLVTIGIKDDQLCEIGR
jgi:hypothetical protein